MPVLRQAITKYDSMYWKSADGQGTKVEDASSWRSQQRAVWPSSTVKGGGSSVKQISVA